MEEVKDELLLNEEKLKNAEELLKNIKSNGNAYEIYKSLLSLLKLYEDDNDFNKIPDLVDEYIQLFNYPKERLTLLNYKITALLKLEDYNELLKTLDQKSEIELLSTVERANILFYKSIAFEALYEYDLAIKALESIDDNISRYSLVNKYLKLAILYLKVNKPKNAEEAYKYALRLDPSHKNDMYTLVESDLYYASGKYIDALSSFQEFFLKSPNKYKYLDRYILINVKLNRIDDAYNFYKAYLNKTQLRLSKGNKYSFFKAAQVLFKEMNKAKELDEVNAVLEEIKPEYFKKEEKETEKIIEQIIKSMSAPLTIYDKRKNIVNKFLKSINNILGDYALYIEYDKDYYLYHKFNNTQMREVQIKVIDVYNKNLVDYFEFDNDKELDIIYDHNLDEITGRFKAYLIKNEYKTYGYLLFSYKEKYDFVYSILRDAILETFIKLDIMTKNNDNLLSFTKIIEKENRGFIAFRGDSVEFLSSSAKNLFKEKNYCIKLRDFMSHFLKPLYIDELIKEDSVTLDAIVDDNKLKIEFKLYYDGVVLYAIIKEVKEELEEKEMKESFYYSSDSGFLNINSLKEEIESRNDSYAIIGFKADLIEDIDSITIRENKLLELSKQMKKISPSSRIYYLGENHFLYLLYITDKRTLESIYNRTIESFKYLYKYSYSLREIKPSGFISKALKNKKYNEVKDLIEYGFYYSISRGKLLFLDNDEKRDYALFKTYESEILRNIKENSFNLHYYPIINEKTRKIQMFMPENIYPYNLDYSTYKKIVEKNNLESKSDMNMIEKLLIDVKEFNPNLRYLIKIEKESISNPNFIKKFSSIYKDSKLDGKIVFYVDNIQNEDFIKGVNSLKKMGIDFAVKYDFYNINQNLYINYKYIILNNDGNAFTKYIIDGLMNILKKTVILTSGDYIDNTLSLKPTFGVYSKEKIKSF